MFYLNPKNGITYNIVAQAPQYTSSVAWATCKHVPMSSATATKPEILADVATISRTTEMPVITHYNIRRTLDIYGNVQDRDLGAVSRAINRIVAICAQGKGSAEGQLRAGARAGGDDEQLVPGADRGAGRLRSCWCTC